MGPCPFCGHKAVQYHRYEISGEHTIECEECPVVVFFDVDITKEDAIKIWNKRAALQPESGA